MSFDDFDLDLGELGGTLSSLGFCIVVHPAIVLGESKRLEGVSKLRIQLNQEGKRKEEGKGLFKKVLHVYLIFLFCFDVSSYS